MLAEAQALKEQMVQWRRTIHQWPELGFEVHRTAALVTDTLAALGVEARSGVGKTGVVAYLGDGDGPVIGVRADMDALPIHEANAVPYASQTPGKMHACGHDAHTAMLLGVAALLSRRSFPGQVRLLFQPSEEGGYDDGVSGAPRMIADGALDGVDAVIALHVHGTVDTGTIMVDEGVVGAAVDTFRVDIIGRGGHGAYPHETLDPIWLTSQVLNALYAIPSRRITPLQPSVVTVGVVRGRQRHPRLGASGGHAAQLRQRRARAVGAGRGAGHGRGARLRRRLRPAHRARLSPAVQRSGRGRLAAHGGR